MRTDLNKDDVEPGPDSPVPETAVLDALVIGAGPAGIGTALALDTLPGIRLGVIERGVIGQAFRDWPETQAFLTPSFTGNGFGATDLNSVHPETSPAFSLGVDYPTGDQYARYLTAVAQHYSLPVMQHTDVTSVRPDPVGFRIETSRGTVCARHVVWAAGEFHSPRVPSVRGSGLLDHSSTPPAWRPREGRLVVIGGYESGIDIACHHARAGTSVTVVDAAHPWDAQKGSDPSFNLAPRTRMRLRSALETGRLQFRSADVERVQRSDGPSDAEGFFLTLSDGTRLASDSRPIAATGFSPELGPVESLFELRDDGLPLVDDDDQSTTAPGLFLSGPSLRHGTLKLCFIYKFRQRFAHVARVIGDRLGADGSGLELWREQGMVTDDLSCCGVECAC